MAPIDRRGNHITAIVIIIRQEFGLGRPRTGPVALVNAHGRGVFPRDDNVSLIEAFEPAMATAAHAIRTDSKAIR